MEQGHFLKLAEKRFGDKIAVSRLNVSDEDAARLNLTKEQIEAYPEHAWIVERNGHYRCPVCDSPLGGLFGSFAWGLVYGQGTCTHCKKARFQYYHHIVPARETLEMPREDRPKLIQAFALTGF